MISEEDVLALQSAVLETALAQTAPGQTFLSLSTFRQLVDPRFEPEALQEMLRELVAEGVLELGPPSGGENRYSVTSAFLASLGR